MTKLVTMTFEEASKWIASQEDRISTLATELAAAHIQCGHNQLTINALGERCSALEAALREAIEWNWMEDGVPTEVKERIRAALGSIAETPLRMPRDEADEVTRAALETFVKPRDPFDHDYNALCACSTCSKAREPETNCVNKEKVK